MRVHHLTKNTINNMLLQHHMTNDRLQHRVTTRTTHLNSNGTARAKLTTFVGRSIIQTSDRITRANDIGLYRTARRQRRRQAYLYPERAATNRLRLLNRNRTLTVVARHVSNTVFFGGIVSQRGNNRLTRADRPPRRTTRLLLANHGHPLTTTRQHRHAVHLTLTRHHQVGLLGRTKLPRLTIVTWMRRTITLLACRLTRSMITLRDTNRHRTSLQILLVTTATTSTTNIRALQRLIRTARARFYRGVVASSHLVSL